MTKDLSNIKWHELTHAYGSADDIPKLLEAIENNATERSSAYTRLYSSICHQGTVFQATSYVVPFLVQFLELPTVSDELYIDILCLLNCIATDIPYSSKQHLLKERQQWLENTRLALIESINKYLDKLNHPVSIKVVLSIILSNVQLTPQLAKFLENAEKQPALLSDAERLFPCAEEPIAATIKRLLSSQG